MLIEKYFCGRFAARQISLTGKTSINQIKIFHYIYPTYNLVFAGLCSY